MRSKRRIVCENCGGSEFRDSGGISFCTRCGVRADAMEVVEMLADDADEQNEGQMRINTQLLRGGVKIPKEKKRVEEQGISTAEAYQLLLKTLCTELNLKKDAIGIVQNTWFAWLGQGGLFEAKVGAGGLATMQIAPLECILWIIGAASRMSPALIHFSAAELCHRAHGIRNGQVLRSLLTPRTVSGTSMEGPLLQHDNRRLLALVAAPPARAALNIHGLDLAMQLLDATAQSISSGITRVLETLLGNVKFSKGQLRTPWPSNSGLLYVAEALDCHQHVSAGTIASCALKVGFQAEREFGSGKSDKNALLFRNSGGGVEQEGSEGANRIFVFPECAAMAAVGYILIRSQMKVMMRVSGASVSNLRWIELGGAEEEERRHPYLERMDNFACWLSLTNGKWFPQQTGAESLLPSALKRIMATADDAANSLRLRNANGKKDELSLTEIDALLRTPSLSEAGGRQDERIHEMTNSKRVNDLDVEDLVSLHVCARLAGVNAKEAYEYALKVQEELFNPKK